MPNIVGSAATETIIGTTGDDMIDHGGGSDLIDGGAGDDTVWFFNSSRYYYIKTLMGITKVFGYPGASTDYAGSEAVLYNVEHLHFTADNVTLDLAPTPAGVMFGAVGTDSSTIVGTSGDDIIDHRGGSDAVDGGDGYDIILFFNSSSYYTVSGRLGQIRVTGNGQAAPAYTGQEVMLTNVEGIQFLDKRLSFGGYNDETLHTWSGRDIVDGGDGTDTVVFSGNEQSYTIKHTSSGFTVNATSNESDTNTLTQVERLQFADLTLAFDLYDGSPLYRATLMGAAAMGKPFIDNPNFMGIALDFAEQYPDMQTLAEAVVDLGLYDHMTNQQFVRQMFQNVQHTPTAQETALYEWALSFGFERSQVLRVFAEGDYNEQSIDLVGLQHNGIEFV